MPETVEDRLVELATESRERAYHFPGAEEIDFGVALINRSGNVFTGANIEHPGYTLTRHAEMRAVDNMVDARDKKNPNDILIAMLVVVGDPEQAPEMINDKKPAFPCGSCRDYISPFSDKRTIIVAADIYGNRRRMRFYDLHPEDPFRT